MTFPVRWIFAHAAIAIVTVVLLAAAVDGYPKPSAVPTRWELDLEPGDLRLYVDPFDQTVYWYFTYKVTNQTGKDQLWVPKFTLFTDGGEILFSGKGVPDRVTQDLLLLLRKPMPFLEDQNTIIGDLFQGNGNAKEGLVIWPARNLEVNEVSLFIAGISGETARVSNPVTNTEQILQKTLQRDYLISGNLMARRFQPMELVAQEWIFR